jgi:ATP-binding cassette, subfamily B, bacterial
MKKSHGNPVTYLYKKMWHYSEDRKSHILLYVGMFIIVGIFESLVEPMVWSHIMNKLQQEGITSKNIHSILGTLSLIIVSALVFWSLHGPARVIERNTAFQVRVNYRKFLTKGTLGLPLEWHKVNHSGRIIDQMTKGTQALFSFSETSFEIVYACLDLIISCTVLALFLPWSLVITLGMLGISICIIGRFDKTLNDNNRKLMHAENGIAQITADSIGNMTTVIVLRIQKSIFGSIMEKTRKPFSLFRRNNIVNEYKWFSTNLLCSAMVVIVFGLYIIDHIDKQILFGNLFLLQTYLRNISKLFSRFAGMYNRAMFQQIQVMNAEELTKNFEENPLVNHVLPSKWINLSIKDLSFSYTGSQGPYQLQNVSLEIRHGQKIAVVGESGSGKSTFLNVMRNLLQSQTLQLTIDGTVIEDGFAGIAEGIALIPQKPEIFASTVRENITLGVSYPDDLIQEALKLSCFDEVVEKLPNGLETNLGEDGLTLSGGQQQRLALARGILASIGKDIILADEPTSSLDPKTARQVFEGILNKFRDKTVICNIHDLGMLKLFDTVFVFDKAKLVGVGTAEELLGTCQEFRDLYQS